jgi:transaldolase
LLQNHYGEDIVEQESYLRWLVRETPTTWWHDSGDLDELRYALEHGASGVTTNPLLSAQAWRASRERWASILAAIPKTPPAERAEALMKHVVTGAAQLLLPVYERTGGQEGYVCAQVNPSRASDFDTMFTLAKRFITWAPNIAVKLPVTRAGLDVLEECAALGITVTATVSFTVPQVLAIAERYQAGLARARKAGIKTGRCFAVIMIGRLDDFLREVAQDRKAAVSEADIRQAGLAVTKRAYALYQERGYEAVLLIAALRGTYHMTELAGARLVMSIHPKVQAMLTDPALPRESHIGVPVPPEVIQRLRTIPDFVRAYEPDGMAPIEFVSYGVTQRTLGQFVDSGWGLLETFA